jgi:hypothetical protein
MPGTDKIRRSKCVSPLYPRIAEFEAESMNRLSDSSTIARSALRAISVEPPKGIVVTNFEIEISLQRNANPKSVFVPSRIMPLNARCSGWSCAIVELETPNAVKSGVESFQSGSRGNASMSRHQ